MIRIPVSDKVYGRDITILIGPEAEANDYFKKKYNVTYELKFYAGLKTSIENTRTAKIKYYIWMEKFEWTIRQQAVLVHETLHLTFEVMNFVGITYCRESEEAFTYYMDFLYESFLKALSKIINK